LTETFTDLFVNIEITLNNALTVDGVGRHFMCDTLYGCNNYQLWNRRISRHW